MFTTFFAFFGALVGLTLLCTRPVIYLAGWLLGAVLYLISCLLGRSICFTKKLLKGSRSAG